jgi:hypothetical protein
MSSVIVAYYTNTNLVNNVIKIFLCVFWFLSYADLSYEIIIRDTNVTFPTHVPKVYYRITWKLNYKINGDTSQTYFVDWPIFTIQRHRALQTVLGNYFFSKNLRKALSLIAVHYSCKFQIKLLLRRKDIEESEVDTIL